MKICTIYLHIINMVDQRSATYKLTAGGWISDDADYQYKVNSMTSPIKTRAGITTSQLDLTLFYSYVEKVSRHKRQ